MFKFTKLTLAATLLGLSGLAAAANDFHGLGRPATPDEIKAWDIDVRPDFKGLPPGSGSVSRGAEVFEARCATCHGSFGESNEVFTPLTGGITKEDIAAGRVAGLQKGSKIPQKSTLMKVASVSTLWDYINRAMPWNAPKSLSTDEVYSVLAYILSIDGIVPEDFVLTNKNIADVQKRMPNRNGMTHAHGMWSVKDKPDVKNIACMKDCATEIKVTSSLPDYARNAHGNLLEQNRVIGPVRGIDTTQPAGSPKGAAKSSNVSSNATPDAASLLKKNNCTACHATNSKLVGPAFKSVAQKYATDDSAEQRLVEKVTQGGQGVWGAIPMPSHAHVDQGDIKTMVKWILQTK
jgi:S-disulfanyl-L-cysteine oxidoreductase SoxD